MNRFFLFAIGVLLVPSAAHADNDKAIAKKELVTCTSTEGIAKILSKFDDLGADKRDIVDANFTAQLTPADGGVMPERIFVKDGAATRDLTLDQDGEITDFDDIRHHSRLAELCIEDPTRIGQPKTGDDFKFDMGINIGFKETSGMHSLQALREGAKDGRSFFKKLMPGPMAMMVPKFKYVTVTYEDEATEPDIVALKGETVVAGLLSEPFEDSYVVSLKALEEMGADGLRISGGPYRLSPSPSVEKLQKYAKK